MSYPRKPASFQKDLREGRQAEEWVCHLFRKAGLSASLNEDKQTREERDIDLWLGGPQGVEVKFDKRSAETGNLALEYWNPLRNKPSGLLATRASLWVHVLPLPLTAFVAPVAVLKQFIAEVKPVRLVQGAGDDNADILLYPLERLFPIFYSLDETPTDELPVLLRRLVAADP